MNADRMPLEKWAKLWMYIIMSSLVILPSPSNTARPRFDTSTDMGLVLVPADAEIDSVIFRLRATDQDADFPLIFDITATVTPIVRIENLPCTLYNKICQANVILTRRLVPGRLHDFAVRVRDSKGDSNSMQATISVTNATTQRDKIFPHIPAIIMVPENTKPGKELDYVLVRSNQWSGKPVYIELWQPKELFTIRQRQTPAETRGVITLIGELDFETQSMHTLTMYATDPYTEPKKDTRNIAGLHLVVIVQDVQDVPPIFTMAPPLTKINNTVQPGDMILRVHAEDGDKGVPRDIIYGLVSEGNPFTPFFNISETTGEITLARSLEELTQITHVGAPIVLSIVAEEIRRSTLEPPAQATVVEVGLLLGEPGNSPPFFENDNYVAWIDENSQPGSVVNFTDHYSTKVRDEDIGKAGVFALKLYNNNGTFEISPAVAERTANFIITIRDNSLIDYEIHKNLQFKITAQEVGPATNLSATVPVTIFIRDINDNPPEFDLPSYEVTISENITAGTRVLQVHATDKDTGSFGRIQYTRIIGPGNEALAIDPDTGIISVAMGNVLDRELTESLQLSIEARDEDGKGLRGIVPLVVNLLDVNDNAPIFDQEKYEFTLNEDSTNFTVPAKLKASDADAEPPNNEIRYELIHGNYENKFYLDEITGELFLREPINKIRRTRHNPYENFATKVRNGFVRVQRTFETMLPSARPEVTRETSENSTDVYMTKNLTSEDEAESPRIRKKRESDDVLFTLTARAYDLGVPHLYGVTQINVMKGPVAGARIVSFVVPGENPDPVKTAETLAAITGGRITVQEIRPYTIKDIPNGPGRNVPSPEGGRKSIVVARVEPNNGETSFVDIERIKAALAANGVGVIGGEMPGMNTGSDNKPNSDGSSSHNTNTNTITNITTIHSEEVTVYRAENRLLFWLLIILGLLMLIALIVLIICCICPSCPFYMAPRKRRVHSSETLIARSDGRPKRHLHRKHARLLEESWAGKKQAWSADPMRRNWQFNRRNQKAGLASLPGDVRTIDREHEILDKTASLQLRDGPVNVYPGEIRRPEDERIYIEDMDPMRGRGWIDVENQHQHDVERGMGMSHRTYMNQEEQRDQEAAKFIREQHYYRDGNAEILRFVTRGPLMDDGTYGQTFINRPQTLVIEREQPGASYRNDGKDILLQRFIEDQKNRHAGQDLHDSFQDIEGRSMESHQRQKDAINVQAQQHQANRQTEHQQKILLIPDRLEDDHRQHIEELGPEVQRLIIDHGSVDKTPRYEAKDSEGATNVARLTINPVPTKVSGEKLKEGSSRHSVNVQNYTIHDLELARQNALLTRLLLERDVTGVVSGAMVDSASYLETQSLPGQVAIATQTDRTAATQTELPNRSRSDNDESEEEARMRRKMKSKKRYGDSEARRIRALWMKSPIEEEDAQQQPQHHVSEKRGTFVRKKARDIKDGRRSALEAEVLQEISDSLEDNGDHPQIVKKRERREDYREELRYEKEDERLEDSSSIELPESGEIPVQSESRTTNEDEARRRGHRSKRNPVEPSFRILEKEMSSLSKKLSRLAGKKVSQSSNNASETDSHDRTKIPITSSKKIEKKVEAVGTKKIAKDLDNARRSRSKPREKETSPTIGRSKIREEIVDCKTRVKYRTTQPMSTGSSDFEETIEKLKRSTPLVTQSERQRQVPGKASSVKLKRQSRLEHKEIVKPTGVLALPQETAESKDTSDSASKGSIKSWKSERDTMRTKRYNAETVDGKTSSERASPSSDNLRDKTVRKKDRPVLGRKNAVESSEIVRESPIKSNVKTSVRETDAKKKTTEISKMVLNVVPETVGIHERESIEEAIAVKKSDDSEQNDTLKAIKHEVPIVLEETAMDFITEKTTNGIEALKEDHPSMTKMAEKIKDAVIESVTPENVRETGPKESKEEKTSEDDHLSITKIDEKIKDVVIESVTLEDAREKSPKESKEEKTSEDAELETLETFEETADPKQQITEGKTIIHQHSEDGGMFSDNFDSFCGTCAHLKGPVNKHDPKDEISYEILKSQSSEEQIEANKIPAKKISTQKSPQVSGDDEMVVKTVKVDTQKIDVVAIADVPIQASTKKDIEESETVATKNEPIEKSAKENIEESETVTIQEPMEKSATEHIEESETVVIKVEPIEKSAKEEIKGSETVLMKDEPIEKSVKDDIVKSKAAGMDDEQTEKSVKEDIDKNKRVSMKDDRLALSDAPIGKSAKQDTEKSEKVAMKDKPTEKLTKDDIDESKKDVIDERTGKSMKKDIDKDQRLEIGDEPMEKSTKEDTEESKSLSTIDDAIEKSSKENTEVRAKIIDGPIKISTEEDKDKNESTAMIDGPKERSPQDGIEKIIATMDQPIEKIPQQDPEKSESVTMTVEPEEKSPEADETTVEKETKDEAADDLKKQSFLYEEAKNDDTKAENITEKPVEKLETIDDGNGIPLETTDEPKETLVQEEIEKSIAIIDDSIEKPGSPQVVTITETLEQKPLSITPIPSPNADKSPEGSPKIVSHTPTPIPQESITQKTTPDMTPSDVTHPTETKSEHDIEKPIDASKDTTEVVKSPEREQIDLGSPKEDIIRVPIVPSLSVQILDDKVPSVEGPSEQTPETTSLKSSPRIPHEIDIETASQKEFGIADSLFVDAKLVPVPSSPEKIISETSEGISREDKHDNVKIEIDVPPVDLAEFSQTMLEDDDSDSSEASSKTMLTARPYGTPRHRPVSNSNEVKPSETSAVSMEMTPIAPGTLEMSHGPTNKDGEAPVDESAEQTLLKSPVLSTDAEPAKSGRLGEERTSPKDAPSLETAPVAVSTEIPKKQPGPSIQDPGRIKKLEPETSIQDSGHVEKLEPETSLQDPGHIEKLEGTTQKKGSQEEATEQVQLNQIRQERLPADPDGFVSLPETNDTLKSLDDTSLTGETPLSEEIKKLPVEIAKETVHKLIVEPPKVGIKIMPPTKKETKRSTRKRDSSKEDPPREARKAFAESTKTSPKKEKKVKALKEESSKMVKETTIIERLVRTRESKRQVRPTELHVEEQTSLLSRTDQNRQTWRKKERSEKDVPVKKVEKVKNTASVNAEKSVGKSETELRAKQEKLKDSRVKKIQRKVEKMGSKKMTPADRAEQVLPAKDIHQKKTKDPEVQNKKDAAESINPAQEDVKAIPVIETAQPIVPDAISISEEVKVGEANVMAEKPILESSLLSSENDELSGERELNISSAVEQIVEPEKAENLPEDIEKQASTMKNEKIASTVIKPIKIIPDHVSEITQDVAPEQEIRSKNASNESEGKLEPEKNIDNDTAEDKNQAKLPNAPITTEKTPRKSSKPRRETETVVIESQSRYMEWYKLKREEMERKRQERRDGDEEEERPKWLRKSTRQRWFKGGPDDKRIFDPNMTGMTPSRRRKIRPLVNMESEQLKAIVRQGRKLRRAQGEQNDEPEIQIFAPEKPPTPLSTILPSSRCHHHHHLVQHSEYKYEKMPIASFYLHPPPAPHTTPQISPLHCEDLNYGEYSSLPTDSRCHEELYEPTVLRQQQCASKLRHGQLLEKKSVFDIAYSGASPSRLRSDSTTPPS